MSSLTDTVLMVEPTAFGFNLETSVSNSFQKDSRNFSTRKIQELAKSEFLNFVNILEKNHLDVIHIKDDENSKSPDSIFPNNWFSTHIDGSLILYPMAAENRRLERRLGIVQDLKNQFNYSEVDLSYFEDQNIFLEGTGAMVLDRINRIAYAAISGRMHRKALLVFCEKMNYTPIVFTAHDSNLNPIYHTNVLMCCGESFIAIGLSSVIDEDRARLKKSILESGKTIIELSEKQINNSFNGNMLQLKNKMGEKTLVLSQSAIDGLNAEQKNLLKSHNNILIEAPIPIIETIGGGSVRCMMAEIFKPQPLIKN